MLLYLMRHYTYPNISTCGLLYSTSYLCRRRIWKWNVGSQCYSSCCTWLWGKVLPLQDKILREHMHVAIKGLFSVTSLMDPGYLACYLWLCLIAKYRRYADNPLSQDYSMLVLDILWMRYSTFDVRMSQTWQANWSLYRKSYCMHTCALFKIVWWSGSLW